MQKLPPSETKGKISAAVARVVDTWRSAFRKADSTTTNDKPLFTPFVTDTCKGIATLMLLAHHLWFARNPALYSDSLHSFAFKCKVCVAVFLVLSGAGIELSGCGWRKTYLYRVPKLLLNYWVVVLVFVPIGIGFFGVTFRSVYPDNGWTFLLQLFGLNWITSTGGFNPTWWFMDIIIPYYLVSPLLALSVRWNAFATLLLAVVATMVPVAFPHWNWIVPFVAGMAAVKMGAFECRRNWGVPAAGLVVCIAALSVFWHFRSGCDHDYLAAFFLIYAVAASVFLLRRGGALLFAPISFLGKHSMNIFLCHTFFRWFWFRPFFDTHRPYVTFPVLLFVSLMSSMLLETIKKKIGFQKLVLFLEKAGKK